MESGSSSARVIRLSKVSPIPAAPSPFRTKMFSVLKVSKFWFPAVPEICCETLPPFGASGRT
jgi:hypothetical protein